MADHTLDPQRLIFSQTASHRGRSVSVSPGNSNLRHLCYGRILLGSDFPRVEFETESRETALLCMRGACQVTVDGAAHDIDLYDAIYVPRGSKVEVTTTGEV